MMGPDRLASMSIDYGPVKDMTKAIWSLGDYSPLAKLLDGAAREVVEACAVSPGDEVLDVAAGTGNCAIAAARKGAHVVASDLTPALVEIGRARTNTEGLDVEWFDADVEDLPFEDGRFDFVTSVFGAIFAPRPALAASEMVRVLRPNGIVGMANWTPESFSRQMMDVVSKYAPPSPVDLPSPFQWGAEDTVRSLFEGVASIQLDRRVLDWKFESFEAMRDVFESHGGAVMAKRMQPPDVYESTGRDLEDLVREVNRGTQDGILIRNEYLLVVAHKA
jgi:ubiquinone/menaquinone biosynthesis C-methylase UbiE